MLSPGGSSRQFSCRECGKMFPTRQNVIRHSRIHTGVKPFPCGYCASSFNDRSNMRRHRKRTHGVDKDPEAADSYY